MKMNTTEKLYMNPFTGSIDTESNWIAEGADLSTLCEVDKDGSPINE